MSVLIILLITFVLLGSSLWVGLALMGVGIFGLELFKNMPVLQLLGQDLWSSLTSPELVALPLFILMGDILFHTRLAEQLFRGLAPWVSAIPGRLLHVNVVGSTIFAAASGSSAATAATIGKITLPELLNRGYAPALAMGSLASAGALGLLIPPSVVLIVYGVLTGTSILKLFAAGIVPGLALGLSFSLYITIRCMISPELLPAREPRLPLGAKIKASVGLLPMVGLVSLVIGSMYAGWAVPSEAAIMGVLGALAITVLEGSLSPRLIWAAIMSSVRTCAMLGLILGAALFLAKALAFLAIPATIGNFVAALGLSPLALIFILIAVYIVLGCFLDGTSMIVMTLPVTYPLVTAAGYDPIWFGVFLVLVAEMGAVTPPVGFNLFVVQSLTGASLGDVAKATLPFFGVMVAFTMLLTFVPQIVLWLPSFL